MLFLLQWPFEQCMSYIPYNGKLAWERIFTNFANWRPLANIFPREVSIIGVVKWAFSDLRNLSPRNLASKQFAKIFSHDYFPLYGIYELYIFVALETLQCVDYSKDSFFATHIYQVHWWGLQ